MSKKQKRKKAVVAPPATKSRAAAGFVVPTLFGDGVRNWLTSSFEITFASAKPDKSELHDAVERQIDAIHAELPADWQGHVEVEPIAPELTDTYAVAFTSAQKNCQHPNSHSTLYARRERQCEDCGRYFTPEGVVRGMTDFAAFDRAFDEAYPRRPDTVLEGIAKFLTTASERPAETSSTGGFERQPVPRQVAVDIEQRSQDRTTG